MATSSVPTPTVAPKPSGEGLRQVGGMVLALGMAVATWVAPIPGATADQIHFLALLVLMTVLTIFEVLPVGVVGLLFLVLTILFHLAPVAVAFAGFTSPIFWLMVASFLIGTAAHVCGLGRRLAYWVMVRLRANTPGRLLFAFLLAGSVLSVMTPSWYARLAVFIPVGLGLLDALELQEGSPLSKFIIMSVYFGAVGSYLMFMTGEEPALLTIASLEKHGVPVYWSTYFWMWAVPGLLLTVGLNYVVTRWLFPIGREEADRLARLDLAKTLASLGPLSSREKRMAVWFGLAVLLWASDFLTHLNPTWVALMVVVGLFFPGIGVLGTEDRAVLRQHLDVLFMIFFGAALSIGAIMHHLALDQWAGTVLAHSLRLGTQPEVAVLGLSAATQVMHIPLATVTSTLAVLSPILLDYARAHGINMALTAWAMIPAANVFLFPYQNEPLLITYGLGHITMRDVLRVGFWLSLGTLVLTPLCAAIWWSWTIPMVTR